MQIIDEKITKDMPKLYTQDGLNKEAIVYLIIEGINGWKWYLTEFDGNDTFFGFVQGFYDEWGYVAKSELNKLISNEYLYITSTEQKKLKEYI